MGLLQGSPLSPVLYNVYTKGLADLNQNGLSRVLTLADYGLIYKTTRDTPEVVEAVQQQLENNMGLVVRSPKGVFSFRLGWKARYN